jgi:predicted metalloendopeptidase
MATSVPAVPSAQENFYLHVNQKWLTSEDGQIPPEYSRWGGFTKLHDTGLKKQIQLVQELASNQQQGHIDSTTNGSLEDTAEEKILAIWTASNQLFNAWELNDSSVANLNAVSEQLTQLDSLLGKTSLNMSMDGSAETTSSSYPVTIAKVFQQTFENGISNVLSFDKGSDLKNSNNVLLDVCISGLSLPSRDYYLELNFEEQRKSYLQHLSKVRDIVNKAIPVPLPENWDKQVMQFETELAFYTMKPSQRREYDKYYTSTTLTDFYVNINNLNSLPSKEENYANLSPDVLQLTKNAESYPGFRLNASQTVRAGIFLETVYSLLDFRQALAKNCLNHYADDDSAKPHKEAIVCFDGDGLRRVICMILDPKKTELYKAYLQYKIISSFEGEGTKELNDEFFDFYGRKLSGQSEQKPYDKRSIAIVNEYAGELLGQLFVKRYFPEECKARMLKLINEILATMKLSIKRNDWMTDETKVKALEKLSKFRVKIGYPDEWKDYSDLHIRLGDKMSKIRSEIIRWSKQHEFYDKINAPLNWNEWLMSPQTVNAYFMPTQNEIVFPAAILQPPFFHKETASIDFDIDIDTRKSDALDIDTRKSDALDIDTRKSDALDIDPHGTLDDELLLTAVNLGGIGSVIAHEITHGYDDKGRKFDGQGNLVDWWDSKDAELFKEKTKLMDKQAHNYKLTIDGTEYTLDPALTMGENLADLGGMSLSIQALRNILASASLSAEDMKPYFRVFFKSWANVWKQNSKKEQLLRALKTDPHAPTEFRANLVKNINEFYAAFNVTEQDKMFLPVEDRLCMW